MSSAQSSGRPTSKRDVSASTSASKVHLPAKSPTVVVDGEVAARQIDRLPSPSDVAVNNPAADRRSMRRITADDTKWTLAIIPDLVELTIRHIVSNFAS